MLQLLCVAALFAQDAAAHPKVDQKRVDAAIERGAKFLLEEAKRGLAPVRHPHGETISREELALYTLIHAGVEPSDATFQALLDRLLKKDLEHTYSVSIMAMALATLDRRAHQARIAQCAQFLVDNQCTNGQWSYGKPVPLDRKTPPSKDVATGGGKPGSKPGSTQTAPVITVPKRGHGPPNGDNSNSQYAALGLRACLESNVRFPMQVLADAERWWERSQQRDGGWGYDMAEMPVDSRESYGSMTAGAVGALVIYKHYLKKDFAKAPSVRAGLGWMASNFSVRENPAGDRSASSPGDRRLWHYYWLYALERAGMLHGTEQVGAHEWYPVGAHFLLDEQRADGSWHGASQSPFGMDAGGVVADTCFAILFLRRATRPVKDVASVDNRKEKK